jgi:hypothetical protein
MYTKTAFMSAWPVLGAAVAACTPDPVRKAPHKYSPNPNEENTDTKTTVNSLRILLGCAGIAIASWGMSTQALAASCQRPLYASGLHVLAVPARPSAGIGLNSSQTATTNAGGDDFRRGSIVGLWHTVYTSGGVTAFQSFDQWHADGNEFEAADLQLGAMCQGTWEKTASGTVRLFHVGWNFDPTGVTLVGYFTEIQSDTVSADGKTYDGTFAIQNFDLMGNHLQGQDQSGTTHATRLTVP